MLVKWNEKGGGHRAWRTERQGKVKITGDFKDFVLYKQDSLLSLNGRVPPMWHFRETTLDIFTEPVGKK